MKRWVDIIGYEPVEIEETKPIKADNVLTCCNCESTVIICNIWSKCEHCNYYNAKR
jgi:hypothetical protein